MSLSSPGKFSRLLPIGLSQLIGIACGVIGVKIVSSIVPPEVLGTYGVFLSFSTVGMWLVHAGIIRYVSRHWAEASDRRAMLRVVANAWLKRLPFILACASIGAFAVSRAGQQNCFVVFAALAASAALLSLAALCQTALQAGRQHWHDLGVSAVGSVTRTFAAPLLYVAMNSPAGLYAGFSLHTLLTSASGALSLKPHWIRSSPSHADTKCRIDAVYAGPLFTTLAAATWTLTAVGRWAAAFFFGETVAGHFTLAGSIALIVPAVLGAISLQYYQPTFFAIADDGQPNCEARIARKVERVVLMLCIAGICSLLALRLVAPLLVGPLIDARYFDAVHWIVPCGMFGLTATAAQFYHVMMIAARRERACAHVDLVTAAVLITGSIVAGWANQRIFAIWLELTPLVLLLVTRPVARHHLFKALGKENIQ